MRIFYFIILLSCLAPIRSFGQLSQFETAIKIGNNDSTPSEGSIRWNGLDFEGYDGQRWKSFTNNTPNGGETIRDIDGNIYTIVTIGTQTWMRENLKTSRYNSGLPIPELTMLEEWMVDEKGARCWYWNDQQYDQSRGKLYNFYATINPEGLCPEGWAVPNDADWTILSDFLGIDAGNLMKQVGTDNWTISNADVNNFSGFTALPAGYRVAGGSFLSINSSGTIAVFWSATEIDALHASLRTLNQVGSSLNNITGDKSLGLSVRCIKK